MAGKEVARWDSRINHRENVMRAMASRTSSPVLRVAGAARGNERGIVSVIALCILVVHDPIQD